MPKNTADFVVMVFAITVTSILVAMTLAAIYLSVFTDKDVRPFISIITDLVTALISALVGYLAGRGSAAKRNGD